MAYLCHSVTFQLSFSHLPVDWMGELHPVSDWILTERFRKVTLHGRTMPFMQLKILVIFSWLNYNAFSYARPTEIVLTNCLPTWSKRPEGSTSLPVSSRQQLSLAHSDDEWHTLSLTETVLPWTLRGHFKTFKTYLILMDFDLKINQN